MNNNRVLIGLGFTLLLGVILVSASGYYSMKTLHQQIVGSDHFAEMEKAMLSGDFRQAAKYQEELGFVCPMQELIEDQEISLEELQIMHEWMMSGNFPVEKPDSISRHTWEIHRSHHPELYR